MIDARNSEAAVTSAFDFATRTNAIKLADRIKETEADQRQNGSFLQFKFKLCRKGRKESSDESKMIQSNGLKKGEEQSKAQKSGNLKTHHADKDPTGLSFSGTNQPYNSANTTSARTQFRTHEYYARKYGKNVKENSKNEEKKSAKAPKRKNLKSSDRVQTVNSKTGSKEKKISQNHLNSQDKDILLLNKAAHDSSSSKNSDRFFEESINTDEGGNFTSKFQSVERPSFNVECNSNQLLEVAPLEKDSLSNTNKLSPLRIGQLAPLLLDKSQDSFNHKLSSNIEDSIGFDSASQSLYTDLEALHQLTDQLRPAIPGDLSNIAIENVSKNGDQNNHKKNIDNKQINILINSLSSENLFSPDSKLMMTTSQDSQESHGNIPINRRTQRAMRKLESQKDHAISYFNEQQDLNKKIAQEKIKQFVSTNQTQRDKNLLKINKQYRVKVASGSQSEHSPLLKTITHDLQLKKVFTSETGQIRKACTSISDMTFDDTKTRCQDQFVTMHENLNNLHQLLLKTGRKHILQYLEAKVMQSLLELAVQLIHQEQFQNDKLSSNSQEQKTCLPNTDRDKIQSSNLTDKRQLSSNQTPTVSRKNSHSSSQSDVAGQYWNSSQMNPKIEQDVLKSLELIFKNINHLLNSHKAALRYLQSLKKNQLEIAEVLENIVLKATTSHNKFHQYQDVIIQIIQTISKILQKQDQEYSETDIEYCLHLCSLSSLFKLSEYISLLKERQVVEHSLLVIKQQILVSSLLRTLNQSKKIKSHIDISDSQQLFYFSKALSSISIAKELVALSSSQQSILSILEHVANNFLLSLLAQLSISQEMFENEYSLIKRVYNKISDESSDQDLGLIFDTLMVLGNPTFAQQILAEGSQRYEEVLSQAMYSQDAVLCIVVLLLNPDKSVQNQTWDEQRFMKLDQILKDTVVSYLSQSLLLYEDFKSPIMIEESCMYPQSQQMFLPYDSPSRMNSLSRQQRIFTNDLKLDSECLILDTQRSHQPFEYQVMHPNAPLSTRSQRNSLKSISSSQLSQASTCINSQIRDLSIKDLIPLNVVQELLNNIKKLQQQMQPPELKPDKPPSKTEAKTSFKTSQALPRVEESIKIVIKEPPQQDEASHHGQAKESRKSNEQYQRNHKNQKYQKKKQPASNSDQFQKVGTVNQALNNLRTKQQQTYAQKS